MLFMTHTLYRIPVIILLVLGGAVLTNCEHYPLLDEDQFNLKWAAWEAQGLVNYSVVKRRSCCCSGNGVSRIFVQDNTITKIERVGNYPDAHGVQTISEVYELVNIRNKDGSVIQITYNEEFHYPETIRFAPLLFRKTTIIEMSEFTPLSSEDLSGGDYER